MYKTREEIENWLIEMKVKNYIINEDLTVDVQGDVYFYKRDLKGFLIKFGVVNGDFTCSNNKLTSLKGCPKEVKGDFYCDNNDLKSLEGCPEIVGIGFYCSYNYLQNLEDSPRKVNGNFNCSDNELTSLEGCSKEIKGDFYCDNNDLKSLEGCSEVIKGNFYCNNNKLTSLKGCPEVINSGFNCNFNKLTSLEYFPKEINGEFIYMNENEIKEEELVNFYCDIKNVTKIHSDFNEDGDKEEFLEKVNFYKIKKENELLTDISKNSNNVKLNKKL